jgi:hypothetical protein
MAKDLLAPGCKRFEFRKGSGFKSWGGMKRNGDDAAAMNNNQFTLLQNIRFSGGDVRSRYGQAKVNSSGALLSKVDMINADEDGSDGKDGGVVMYAGATYVAPPSVPAGLYGSGSVNYWNGSVGAESLSNFGAGDLWFADPTLYHCGGGDPAKIYTFDGTDWTTVVTEAGGWTYTGIIKVGATFYLMTSTGAIRTWDGSSATTSELESAGFGKVGSSTMATDGTDLYVVYADGLSVVRRRSGAWTYMTFADFPPLPPGSNNWTIGGAVGVACLPSDAAYVVMRLVPDTGGDFTCIYADSGSDTFLVEHLVEDRPWGPLGAQYDMTPNFIGVLGDGDLYWCAFGTSPEDPPGTFIGVYVVGTETWTDHINIGGTWEVVGADSLFFRLLADSVGNYYSNHDAAGFLYQWTPDFTGTAALIDGDRSYKNPVLVE